MPLYRAFLMLPVIALVDASTLDQRQNVQCATASYVPCLPPGGIQANAAPDALDWYGEDWLFGTTMSGIGSLGGVKAKKHEASASAPHLFSRQTTGYLCCPTTDSWTCQVLPNYNIPYCFQTTTTQFQLSDGSYGYSSTGEYYLPNGDQVNLNTGDYKLVTGVQGNIYADHGMSPPSSTATGGNSGQSSGGGQSPTSSGRGGSSATASGSANSGVASGSSSAGVKLATFPVTAGLLIVAEMVAVALHM